MHTPSFPPLRIKGKSLLPIVQGGMGVGISAHRLGGHVARHGAVGTLSSVDAARAADSGQFDDMVGPAMRILQDDDSGAPS